MGKVMSNTSRSLQIYLGKLDGKTKQETMDAIPFYDLGITEVWDRLLRKSRLVQRMFPKTAFLKAMDTPPKVQRFGTTSTGPR